MYYVRPRLDQAGDLRLSQIGRHDNLAAQQPRVFRLSGLAMISQSQDNIQIAACQESVVLGDGSATTFQAGSEVQSEAPKGCRSFHSFGASHGGIQN